MRIFSTANSRPISSSAMKRCRSPSKRSSIARRRPRDDPARTVTMRPGTTSTAVLIALVLGIALDSAAAAQSSGLDVGSLNAGGSSSNAANGPNGLQGITGATTGGTPKAVVADQTYDFG